ncbi:hypothetical protein [Methylobacterium sp. Gmos1]
MATPARVDQEIWRGDDTPPLTWGFGPASAPEIPTDAGFRIEIGWTLAGIAFAVDGPASGEIIATSDQPALAIDLTAGTVAWRYSTDQSASIPSGARAWYVLRCLYQGTTQTWAEGRLIVRGGGAT